MIIFVYEKFVLKFENSLTVAIDFVCVNIYRNHFVRHLLITIFFATHFCYLIDCQLGFFLLLRCTFMNNNFTDCIILDVVLSSTLIQFEIQQVINLDNESYHTCHLYLLAFLAHVQLCNGITMAIYHLRAFFSII